MINKLKYLAALTGMGFSLLSCGDLGDVNVDPEAITPEAVDSKLEFTNVQ